MRAATDRGRVFPWQRVMELGLGLLRLTPEGFWSMTPRELAAAFSILPDGPVAAPERADLNALMQRFPDRPASGVENKRSRS